MAFKQERLEGWAAAAFPGEQFVSYVVTGLGTPNLTGQSRTSGTGGDQRRQDLVQQLGLDPEGDAGAGHTTTFLLLTDRRLALGTRSSVRNRPSDLLHSASIEGVRVHWFDHDAGGGNRQRHFVTEFGDGRWRADFSGLTALGRPLKSNAEHFIEALGHRAVEASAS